ncbi:GreA/GreB family elongation factor [Roseovarius dicentrarchi]|uniref:GreA/GreB family elongation factor n=1 Tax=Roseovarius dicentrarchi TaxID=2250573 RepID=UPI000DEBABF0|nr:GreA/GreB family elongation factor [Roseovarius dicentrarchi]
MNKAFTKEDDGSTTPQRLDDLPISAHPNHVTPEGLAQLHAREAALEAEISRLRAAPDDPETSYPLAVAERDLRYVIARLGTAILIEPPSGEYPSVQFGAAVDVLDEDGTPATYIIVGEDEADPKQGLIAAPSPLARALLEAEQGDVVEWPRPSGMIELEVTAIRKRG